MSANIIKSDIYSVGVLNPQLRIFDVVMKTDYGTSYNSYIVKGSEKTALIETCHLTFFEQYLNNIKSVCDPEKIDYIILNHCEPDHSGVLQKLTEICKNATIVVSRAGSIYLKNITNVQNLPLMIAKDGDSLDLGNKSLRFINAPFLHWPDSMFTYCEADKTLFSCDFLGAHFCEPYVFDTNIVYKTKYLISLKEYYDAIFSPFNPYVVAGLEKISNLDVEIACTSHGPVLTKECLLPEVIEKYAEWSRPSEKLQKKIAVVFASAYGNTKLIANEIAIGISEVISDSEVELLDVNEIDMQTIQQKINFADAIVVGSPTINADAVAPIWQALSHIDAINSKKKPALVFGSYGWSGEAVPNIMTRLQGVKINVFGE
ncbi:MAG: FprA family A-type flavoprotein [Bacillota bacterium]|nr:FprA family A-type flavoprotein [Bacillota bacterium]